MVQLTSDPVGKSVRRVDVVEKVTGAAVFVDDMQFGPGTYYARLVRSPYAHALVKYIDASRALELPGVKAVVTGKDLDARIGLYLIGGTGRGCRCEQRGDCSGGRATRRGRVRGVAGRI